MSKLDPPPPTLTKLSGSACAAQWGVGGTLIFFFIRIYLYCVVTDARCNRPTYQDSNIYYYGANEHDFVIFLIVSRCITISDSICAARTLSMLPRLYLCLSLTLSVKLSANNTHMSGNGGEKRWEKRVRGNFVHYDFLKLHYIRHKIKDVSPLRVAALTCNSTLYTLPPPPPPPK